MKKFIKKSLCILLCMLVTATSISCVAVAGNSSAYPNGVTAKEALNAVSGTDKLINKAVPMFKGDTLSNMAKPMIYNSENLSNMLVELYKSLEKNKKDIASIGVDVSVSNLSKTLRKYPEVSKTLAKYSNWSEVKLSNVSWGVNNKTGFAEAVAAILSPFNDILYTLLCSGEFVIGNLIEVKGADGYENAVVPLLKSLNCKIELTQLEFIFEADKNKNNMIKNILLPVLDLVEKGLVKPADTLTGRLPGFAYFVESGEFQKSMDSLMSPITSNKLVKLAIFLKILNLDSLKVDVNKIINDFLNSAAVKQGIKIKPVNLSVLAACGDKGDNSFTADKGKAYVSIMRWFVENLKLNKNKLLSEMKKDQSEDIKIDDKLISDILSKDTDVIVSAVTLLFTPANLSDAVKYNYPEIKAIEAVYTPNLTENNIKKVLKNIDSLLDDFAKEGGQYSDIRGAISSFIYTNKNASSVLVSIYKALEDNNFIDTLKAVGVDATPKGIAKVLKANGYKKASDSLSKAKSWKNVKVNSISWGFSNGSRRGFQNALATVLSPLSPMLKVILADENIVFLDSITLRGADGYNVSIIPALEALGCDDKSIKTYSAYKKNMDSKSVVNDILEPVFDLVDDFCEKPIYTLTRIAPNLVYFINNGSLDKCVENLLRPINAMTQRIAELYKIDVKVPKISEKLDLNKAIKDATKKSGVNIAEFDINKVSQMGELKEKVSKAKINGEKTTYMYVESNQLDVLMSMIRIIARTLKIPGNDKLLMSSMGNSDNAAFETYASSLGDKFEEMSEDELIEWLYQLFFKDRVKAELVVDKEYQPTIIYRPKEKSHTWLYFVGGYFGMAAIVGLILFINRKKLYGDSEGSVC